MSVIKQLTITLLATLLSIAGIARAQPVADKVPADAIFYLGWAGTTKLGPDYEQSHTRAVLAESRLRDIFGPFYTELAARIGRDFPEAKEPMLLARDMLTPMAKYPTALVVDKLDFTDTSKPVVKVFIISQAGADAAGLKEKLSKLIADAGQIPYPVRVDVVDNSVVLSGGYAAGEAVFPAGAANLTSSPEFAAAHKQVPGQAIIAAHLNFKPLFVLLDQGLKSMPEQERAVAMKVVEATGLRGLKAMTGVSRIEGKDWTDRIMIAAPSPRKGLLSLISTKPVSGDLLKAVPQNATFVTAGKFDLAEFVTVVRNIAGEVDPSYRDIVDRGLSGTQVALNAKLQEDIFEPLGADWAAYASPTVGGRDLVGLVLVNKLDDPAKATTALRKASVSLNNWISTAMAQAKLPARIPGKSVKIGTQDVYYLGLPVFAPCWTIKDGYLYVSLFPQVAAAAAQSTGGPTIQENATFQSSIKSLEMDGATSFAFMDVPACLNNGSSYTGPLVLARIFGAADMFGVTWPEPMVPSLKTLQANAKPVASAARADDAGWNIVTRQSFPGVQMFYDTSSATAQLNNIVQQASSLGVLLPSLNRARETANRVKQANNFRQIGIGTLMYANENKGNAPPDLATLLTNVGLPVEILLDPIVGNALPADWATMNPQQQADWINNESPYEYLGGGLRMDQLSSAEVIVLIGRPAPQLEEGTNALYGDGHVEWLSAGAIDDALRRSDEALRKPKVPGR